MSKRYNIGVIGYGLSAKVFHIPLITVVPEFKLHAIVQRSPTADNDAGRDNPGVKAYRTVDELFADGDVDVVVVTTHPASHHELTTRALRAGKHVVVEKPFTVNLAEADDLIRVSRETGKWVIVYQNRRWDGDFVTVGKVIGSGAVGRVSEFETHFDRHRPEVQTGSWKMEETGGGVVWDLGSHLLDQVRLHWLWRGSAFSATVSISLCRLPKAFTDGCPGYLFVWNAEPSHWRGRVLESACQRL